MTMTWQHLVHKIKTDTDLATLGTQDKNRYGPGNFGYTRYKQTLAWQHWVHKIQTDTGLAISSIHKIQTDSGLATLGTQDKNEAKKKHRKLKINVGMTQFLCNIAIQT